MADKRQYKEWDQNDAKQREQCRDIKLHMTDNYLLSVKLPLCCYRGLNVSTSRRSFLPELAKYPALLQFLQHWRYEALANPPYISTTFVGA